MLDKDQVEAVLFDLDGTLMDTDDQAVEKLAQRLQKLRWPRPDEAARRFVMAAETPGNALMTLVDVVGLDAPLAAFTDRLHHWRGLRTRSDFRLVADAEEMLAALKGATGWQWSPHAARETRKRFWISITCAAFSTSW